MTLMRRLRFATLLTAALLLACVTFGACHKAKPQELTLLEPFKATESYAAVTQRIQAAPAKPEGFSFVVLGDTRSNYDIAEKVFKAAAAEKPAFILGTGDLVRHGRVEEFISYHLPLMKSIAPVPFISVAGNHEEGPDKDYAAFKFLYGGERFSFDYGECRFVGINNATIWGLCNEDLAYMDQELAKPGVKHRFVVFHVPPRALGVFENSEEGRGFKRNFDDLKKLMKKHKVDNVFMGHVHGFATTVLDGVRFTITGGGGAPIEKRLPEEGALHNYLVVHVQPESLSMEVVRLKGEEWQRAPVQ